jgi:putative flippase GtrA
MGTNSGRRFTRTGLRYLFAGGFVAFIYLATYAALLFVGLQYFVGIIASQAIVISIAFPLYRRFVFGPGASLLTDFVKFLTVWVGGLIAGLIITPLAVEILSWNPWLAQVAAMAIVTAANFVAHRFWTFRNTDEVDTGLNEPK